MKEHGYFGDKATYLSNCCGAPVIWTDICSDCKEHCEPIDEDEEL